MIYKHRLTYSRGVTCYVMGKRRRGGKAVFLEMLSGGRNTSKKGCEVQRERESGLLW